MQLLTLTSIHQKDKVKVTFGLNPKNRDYYGIMMYHKNRLIKAYEKVGCQLKVEQNDHITCTKVDLKGQTVAYISSSMFYRLQVKGQGLGSLVSLSVTFSNLLTTSKTLNTPRSTGA